MSAEDPEEAIAAARAQVEQTREELGETVEALAYKADVKGRAHDKADEVRARAEDAAEQVRAKVAPATEQVRAKAGPTALQVRARAQEIPRPWLAAGVGVVILAALVQRQLRRRRGPSY